jgi:hypothetical protein
MAIQAGLMPMIGTIDELVFYKRRGKLVVRRKGTRDKKWYAETPTLASCRRNNREFANASKAGKLIRESVKPLLLRVKDGYMTNRMMSAVLEIVKKDVRNPWGERKVCDENIKELEGFEFNNVMPVKKVMKAEPEIEIDKERGIMTVFFKPFIPTEMIKAPKGSTHFKIVSAGVSINFDECKHEVSLSESKMWETKTKEALSIELRNSLDMKMDGVQMLFWGVQFYRNGEWKPFSEKNCLRLARVV